jgi:hypothetical protein
MLTDTHVDVMRNSDVVIHVYGNFEVLAVCKLCLLVEIIQRSDPLHCIIIVSLQFFIVQTY